MKDRILNREEIIRKLQAFFRDLPEVRFAYLFGSLSSQTHNDLSDVDVAVFVDSAVLDKDAHSYGYKATLLTEIMQLLKENRVDLVILNQAMPLLSFHVVRYGIPIYEVDRLSRIRFQAKAFSRYFDLKPMFQLHQSRKIFPANS
jgi:predicted nucleotidyltransferase